jgi:hypothetical protein
MQCSGSKDVYMCGGMAPPNAVAQAASLHVQQQCMQSSAVCCTLSKQLDST